jgi:hypothetical protein
MVSSNAKEETIHFFLCMIRDWNTVIPRFFMSDMAIEQLKAIVRVYHESQILFCWWHVLHAWQQHFIPEHYPELWELLRQWIRVTGQNEFDLIWKKIQILAPASFREYLATYYLGGNGQWSDPKYWSGIHRVGRNILEEGDTNMLVEALVTFFFFLLSSL